MTKYQTKSPVYDPDEWRGDFVRAWSTDPSLTIHGAVEKNSNGSLSLTGICDRFPIEELYRLSAIRSIEGISSSERFWFANVIVYPNYTFGPDEAPNPFRFVAHTTFVGDFDPRMHQILGASVDLETSHPLTKERLVSSEVDHAESAFISRAPIKPASLRLVRTDDYEITVEYFGSFGDEISFRQALCIKFYDRRPAQ